MTLPPLLVPHPCQDVPVHQARGDAERLHAQVDACVNTSLGLELSASWLSAAHVPQPASNDIQQAVVSLLHQRLAQSRGLFSQCSLSSIQLPAC